MAFTDITSSLNSSSTGVTIAGAGTIKLQNGICSPYGFAISAYQGTYLASSNLNINSSCASMRLTFTKTGTTGVNIKLRYMVQSEKDYDYGMFGNSGASLTSAITYNNDSIYAHTRTYEYTTPQILDYYIPSSSYIDILYKKDGSTHTGWDRLFVAVMAEAASGGGSGGDTYFWAGAKIYLRGEKNLYSGQYDFSTSQRLNSVANDNSLLEYAGKTKFETITSGSLVVYWTSGTTSANLGTNGSDITVGTSFGGVVGHGENTLSTAKWRIYTGTTAASVMKAYATALSSAPVQLCRLGQNIYRVYVKTSGAGRPKAYYSITFPSTVGGSVTYITGKSGYVALVTSAVSNNSLTVTATRAGSISETITISPNEDANISVPQSHRTDDRIETTDDLYQHDSSLAASYCGSNDHKCIKFDSTIHDSGSSDKLMWHNDFLSFTGTPNYFNDDTMISDSGDGYEINGQPLTINWFNNSPTTVQLTTLSIFGGSVSDGTQLYRITSARNLAGNSSGNFICGIMNEGYADGADSLTAVIATNISADAALILDTQSHGSYYFYFPVGTTTVTLPVQNNITITGGTLTITSVIG